MKLIAAVDKEWGIGKNNQLLFHIKNDMKHFKELTTGKVVVMGRKTFESLPNKSPLPNRTNIVITSNKNYTVENCIIIHTLDDLFKQLKKYNDDDIFVIGGGNIYKQLSNYCTEAFITFVHDSRLSDTFFINLEDSDKWELYNSSVRLYDEKENVFYNFYTYKNKDVVSYR